MRGQGDQPLAWVLIVLLGAAAVCGVFAPVWMSHRRPALLVVTAALVVLGFLAIFSIGLPILLAGFASLVASLRPRPALL